jgi:hemophore-related protein
MPATQRVLLKGQSAMTSSSSVTVAVTLGVLLTAGLLSPAAWVASAQPGDGPLIETTCSYAQLEAALQVEAPEASARLAERPDAQAKLQELVALPVDQRRQRLQQFLDRNPDVRAKIEQKRNTPEGQRKVQMLARIADTCHNY